MPTTKSALFMAIKKLNSSPSSALDAEVLLSFVIKKPREFLYTHPEDIIPPMRNARFNLLIKKCVQQEPVAYLTKNKEFFGLNFYVNKNVLIPRPRTEDLVAGVLGLIKKIPPEKKIILIDVGTGSGCIPIAIMKNLPPKILKKITVVAIDISPQAIAVAKKNAKKFKLQNKILFRNGDLLTPLFKNKKIISQIKKPNAKIRVIITANLPYIKKSDYRKLAPGIRKYEPKIALVAGTDGWKYYQKFFYQIKNYDLFYRLLSNHSLNLFLELPD